MAGLLKELLPAAFIAPAVLILLLVVAYPVVYSIYVSLHATNYLNVGSFRGLAAYTALFRDASFWQNTIVTVKYVVGSLFGAISLGLILAVIFNQGLRYSNLFRTICTLPWVISQTVAALLWLWLLDPSFGPVNYAIATLGGTPINFAADERMALPMLIGVNVWMSYPFALILLSAGLQTISKDIYDAARMDRAGALSIFFRITIPLIKPTLLSTCLILTLYYFTMVTLVLILTGGGPVNSTEILSLRVFNETFLYWHVGYASALGVMILLLNALFSLMYIRLTKDRVRA
jgi:multiple sugar transport system permease protein